MRIQSSTFTGCNLNAVSFIFQAAKHGNVPGSGVAERVAGLDNRQSLSAGFAMDARRAVELVIADIALRAGIFSSPSPPPPVIGQLFSAVVIMAVVTTIITPLTLHFIFTVQKRRLRYRTQRALRFILCLFNRISCQA